MPSSPPLNSAVEHGRRGQIRRYLQKFTTTIRRGSKDDIPQSSETNDAQEHSHDAASFDFTNIITADEPPTTNDCTQEQSRPTPPVTTTETFHIDRASVYQERAQKLHDRYGINIEGNARSTFPATARRVQKTAKMRVHRSCHMCGVDFGHGIHCRACHHRVCGNCPRTSGRRVQDVMAQARDFPFHVVSDESSPDPDSLTADTTTGIMDRFKNLDNMSSSSSSSSGKHTSRPSAFLDPLHPEHSRSSALEADNNSHDFSAAAFLPPNIRNIGNTRLTAIQPRSSRHGKLERLQQYKASLLTFPIVPYPISTVRDPVLKVPAGVQRIYRKPRQRVRYTCHECRTPFGNHVRVCGKCSHERCYDCRDVSYVCLLNLISESLILANSSSTDHVNHQQTLGWSRWSTNALPKWASNDFLCCLLFFSLVFLMSLQKHSGGTAEERTL